MWPWRRGHVPAGDGDRFAASDDGGGRRDRRSRRRGRNAWRVDRLPAPQVAWSKVGELTPQAVPVPAAHGHGRWSAQEGLGEAMPRIYCPRCGEGSPDSARFCARCGAPLPRAGAERPGETTSTISLAGTELADLDLEEPPDAAAVEALLPGTALLVVQRGPNAGSRFLLDHDLTTVGRHPGSDIFLDDVTVSRRHAEFYRHRDTFLVRDVGSLNGTYVNRERIEETDLFDGDEVQVGKFRLVFLAARRSHRDRGGGGAQVGA